MDLNCVSLASEVTVLPTEPQPLPTEFLLFGRLLGTQIDKNRIFVYFKSISLFFASSGP